VSYRQDLLGKKFGNSLVVIKELNVRDEHIYWLCKCSICGEEKTVRGFDLNNGSSSQCNWCYQETRWTVKSKERKKLCVDYISGMSLKDILKKYEISETNRSLIYKILKKEGIKSDRKNTTKYKKGTFNSAETVKGV